MYLSHHRSDWPKIWLTHWVIWHLAAVQSEGGSDVECRFFYNFIYLFINILLVFI